MKKQLLIALFCASYLFVYSQSIELELINPLQRVGDHLSIHYEINPSTINIGNEILNNSNKETNAKPIAKTCKTPDYSIAEGDFRLTKSFDTTGVYNIGPFSFNVEGKSFKSNTMTFDVYPELPKITKGLWVSFLNFENKHFIVIEQRVEGQMNIYPIQISKEDIFVRINYSIFNSDNIEIITENFGGITSTLDGNWYTQKNTIYQIWLSEDYSNNFSLTEKHLANMPEDAKIKPVLIKK
jgi:hypothetical protein